MPSLTRTVASGTPEPVSVGDLKRHARIDSDDEDVLLDLYLSGARKGIEEEYSTALVTQTCVLRLDHFPYDGCYGEIELPVNHVTSVTSIGYVDTNGASQTLATSAYEVDIYSTPARIRPAFGTSWPSTRDKVNAVTVTFVAGYAGPEDVPGNTKAGVLLLAAELYDKREPTVTGAAIARVPGFEALLISEDWGHKFKGVAG